MFIMSRSYFHVPIKRGTFTQLNELPEILTTGIYRCVISKCGDYDKDKLFRFNFTNKYKPADIYSARKLGLKIELIQDDQANALLYGAGTCVNGSKIFGTIVNYLYDLKKRKVPLAKSLCLNIWGGFAQKKEYNKVVNDDDDDEYTLPIGTEPSGIFPLKNGDHIKYTYTGNHFRFAYARFVGFLTAAIRKLMCDAIYENRENIHRCHTDSILTTVDLPDLKIGTELGEWKIEHDWAPCKLTHAHNKPKRINEDVDDDEEEEEEYEDY